MINEHELLGPLAWGEVLGSAQLKATAEDFQVEEVLDIPLTGEGEHFWLWVEKRYLHTDEVAKRIAKFLRIPLKYVSYAGLKDRLALTRQWFSIHLPGKVTPDLAGLDSEHLRIISMHRHLRKLQRGTHSANKFIINLRQLQIDKQGLEQRLALISQYSVPNYFGLQRFGWQGQNLLQALDYAQHNTMPEERLLRSRVLSTVRSYLFNKVLATRVGQQSWNTLLKGDVLSFTDSQSFFPADEQSLDDPRYAALDIHPTGPLWGVGELPTTDEALAIEKAIGETHQKFVSWLADTSMRQQRRILRLVVRDLSHHYLTEDCLQLTFSLPTGCFATAVIRELVRLETLENTCTY